MARAKVVHISPEDNVVVAIAPIAKGDEIKVDDIDLVAAEDIPQGHKVAVAPIAAEGQVIKYGVSIGHTTEDVKPGQ